MSEYHKHPGWKYNGIPVKAVQEFSRNGNKFVEIETLDGSKPFTNFVAENTDTKPDYELTNWTVVRSCDLVIDWEHTR